MVTLNLPADAEKHLQSLALSRGQQPDELVQQLVLDYLDFQATAGDSDDAWAAASLKMAAQVLAPESWPDAGESDAAR